ncbi:XRE family transcriptional regulator [uncultured Desulfuromonas sp.]|uniref:helix-turn-helix domain-containing protein n=1 Tax=uncultured Desulfuromonas sp. TaxID=181013 RepID=UPI002AAA83C9|nr:XRE family transcriptional regulator [uncultured Desulfuromonas sp.]
MSYDIGTKVRELRKNRGVTLQYVANQTGFSAALISQIENNNITPPIATLARLSKFFDVKIGYFFEDEALARYEVVRADKGYTTNNPHFIYKSLVGGRLNKHLKAFSITLSPQDYHYRLPDNGRDKFLFVKTASLTVEVVGENIELDCGDSIYLDATATCQVWTAEESAQFVVVLCL